jgi:pimeloyl-ACP methyl ester carboxylesterase
MPGIAVLEQPVAEFGRGTRREMPKKSRRVAVRWAWMLLALAAASGVLACLAWPRVRSYLQAGAVLAQLNERPLPRVLAPIAGKPIRIEEFQLPIAEGPVRARIYEPAGEQDGPGLLIVPGVYYKGIDEPHLRGYARWMAACGLRVLTPEIPGTRDYQIDPSSVEVIGQSAQWFAQKTGRPVGLMAISFSGGLSLLAAAEPQYASSVKMVFTTGAPDDMSRVAMFYATGKEQTPDGSWKRLQPNIYGPLVVEYSHIDRNDTLRYRELMRSVLHAHLSDDREEEQRLRATMTADQSRELASLLDPDRVGEIIARTTPLMKDKMEAVSPHGHLASLRAPVYLLHGENDPVIPSVEEEWLARDLPPGMLKASLISPAIAHISIGPARHAWLDKLRLWHFMGQVMEAAQAK